MRLPGSARPGAALIACALAVVAAGLVYLNALGNPFVYDDHHQIVENRSLLAPLTLSNLFLQNATRPVLNASYIIDRRLWGPSPFGFHVTNVLLHMLNVALTFMLVLRASRERSRIRPEVVAFGTAILFAVHPMMTQAVGYISGRSEVLYATWFLLALAAADRWMRGGQARWLVTTGVLWLLAVGTKEPALMFPAVLFVYDRALGPWKVPAAQRLRQLYAPIVSLTLVAAIARVAVLGLERGDELIPRWNLVLVEFDVLRRYLWMLYAPVGQAVFHGVAPVRGVTDPRVLFALVVLAAVVAIAWRLRRSRPIAAMGLAWFLLLCLPGFALVAINRAEPMAEHRVYLASVGLFLAVAVGTDWLLQRLTQGRRRIVWLVRVGIVLGIVSLAGRTVLRNTVWADPVGLWQEASSYAPDHWLPYVPLGEALHAQGRHAEAIVALEHARQLRPEETSVLGKLGVCQVETRQLDAAKDTFLRLRAIDPVTLEVPYGLGLVSMASGDFDDARQQWGSVLAADPLNVPVRQALAGLEETHGDPATALRYCEEIRQIAPDTPGNDDCIARNRRRLGGAANGG